MVFVLFGFCKCLINCLSIICIPFLFLFLEHLVMLTLHFFQPLLVSFEALQLGDLNNVFSILELLRLREDPILILFKLDTGNSSDA